MKFEKPDIRYDKPRKPHQIERDEPEDLSNQVLTDDELEQTIDSAKGVKDKAERLLKETERTGSTKCIPVDEDALEVRAAVSRLDPSQPDGAKISYELYMSEVREATAPLSKEDMLEFIGNITGVPMLDSITTRTASKSRGGEEGFLMDAASHAVILYLLGTLLAGYSGQEAAKQGAPNAAGGTASSWALALGMLFLQHSGGDEKIAENLDKLLGKNPQMRSTLGDLMSVLEKEDLTPDSAVENAEQMQMANKQIREGSDKHLVKEYADSKIAENPDLADWGTAHELRSAASQMDSTIEECEKYGKAVGGLVRAPKDVMDVVSCNVRHKNLNLDMTAAALESHYASDMVCCAVRWLGSAFVNTEHLKMLRTLLKFQANGITIDLKKINGRLQKLARQRLFKAILEPMIHSIRKFHKKAAKSVTEWLDPKSHVDENADEKTRQEQLNKWKQIFTCTPIDEIVRYLLAALKHLEKFIIKLLKKLWKLTKIENRGWKKKLGLLGDKKALESQIRMLDALIEAIEKGNLCESEDSKYPDQETVREIARGILRGSALDMNLDPPEGKREDPYWRFNPVSFKTPTGVRVASWEESQAKSIDIEDVAATDCIKGLTDELAIKLPVDPTTEEVTRDVREFGEEFGDRIFDL